MGKISHVLLNLTPNAHFLRSVTDIISVCLLLFELFSWTLGKRGETRAPFRWRLTAFDGAPVH